MEVVKMKSSGMTRRTVGASVAALASVLLVVSARSATAQTALPPGCYYLPAPVLPPGVPPPPPVMVCPPPVDPNPNPPPTPPPPPPPVDPQVLLTAMQA